MRFVLYPLALVALVGVILFAIIIYNTWAEKKTQRQMVRDHDWRMWISQVRTRLEEIEGSAAPCILDREKEWFRDLWNWGHSAAAAVEKWLAERKAPFTAE